MDPAKTPTTVETTLGELAAAFYEAALAELGDKRLASRVTAELVAETMRKSR